jgi:phosphoglycerate dehydrogenase-like enzyme
VFRIALLGNTAAQAKRLGAMLPFPHAFVTAVSSDPVDVVVSLRFGAHEAPLRPRLLHMPGAGLDAVDFASVPADCVVCNVFEHEGPIAEYVMLAMLDWEIGYSTATRSFTAGSWSSDYRSRVPHGELAGKRLGLVGFGHIGKTIAARAHAFGMTVAAIASRPREAEPPVAWIGGPERLAELAAESDYIVIACPLTEATRGLLDSRILAALRTSSVLINVARGDIVDEEALFDALRQQRIACAVLDAWYRYPAPGEDVPPARHPFETLPNVRCTAHISAWTHQLFERRYAVIGENIRRFAAGEPLQNVVRAAAPVEGA